MKSKFLKIELALIGLLVVMLVLATSANVDNGMSAFLDQEDPTLQAYNKYLKSYGSDEVSYLVFDVNVVDKELLNLIVKLSDELELVPFVSRVRNIAESEIIREVDENIVVETLKERNDITEAVGEIIDAGVYTGDLISEDKKTIGLILEMSVSSLDPLEKLVVEGGDKNNILDIYPQVTEDEIQRIIRKDEYSSLNIMQTGDVSVNATRNKLVMNESGLLLVSAIIIASLISLFLFSYGIKFVFIVICSTVLSIISVIGFMSAMGWSLGLLFMIIPPLFTAISFSQTVHYYNSINDGSGISLNEKIDRVKKPAFMASFTTAVGLMGMVFSDILALNQFAIYSAFGMIISFFSALTLSKYLGVENKNSSSIMTGFSDSLLNIAARFSVDKSKYIVALSFLIGVLSVYYASFLKVDVNFLEQFKPHVEVRKNIEDVEEKMSGSMSLVYLVDTRKEAGVLSSDNINGLITSISDIEKLDSVSKIYSPALFVREMGEMLFDKKSGYSQDEIDDIFSMYELSGAEEMNNYKDFSDQEYVVEIRLKLIGSGEIEKISDYALHSLKDNLPSEISIIETGIGIIWVKLANYISVSQIQGYGLVVLIIFISLLFAYKSVLLAVIAISGNVIPISVVMAGMYFAGLDLDFWKLLLGTIGIGLAVDDTVHIIDEAKRRYLNGESYQDLCKSTVSRVGKPIFATSLILAMSFQVYWISDLKVLTSFGVLLSLIVISALIFDLLLLPAAIYLFKPFNKNNTENSNEERTAE